MNDPMCGYGCHQSWNGASDEKKSSLISGFWFDFLCQGTFCAKVLDTLDVWLYYYLHILASKVLYEKIPLAFSCPFVVWL